MTHQVSWGCSRESDNSLAMETYETATSSYLLDHRPSASTFVVQCSVAAPLVNLVSSGQVQYFKIDNDYEQTSAIQVSINFKLA